MAQSKAVLTVLATAVALAGTIDNAELNASIEALKAQEDANGNTQEYKDLKDLLDAIDAQANAGTDTGATPPADNGATQNGADAGTPTETPPAPTPTVDAQADAPAEPKKYSYAGVRMIGSKWYCDKDKYKKGFSTANECAEHFNG